MAYSEKVMNIFKKITIKSPKTNQNIKLSSALTSDDPITKKMGEKKAKDIINKAKASKQEPQDKPNTDDMDDREFEDKYRYERDAHIRSFNDEERETIINKMADDSGVSIDDPIELVKVVRDKDEYGNASLGDIHKHIKDMADKDDGGSDKPKSELEKLDKEIKSTEANMNMYQFDYSDSRNQDMANDLSQKLRKLRADREKLVGSKDESDDSKKMTKKEAKQYVKENKKQVFEYVIKKIINEESQNLINEGTRWLVGIEQPNGKILSTYGHYDGYPEWAGKHLKKYYNNPAKAKELLKLGKSGISTIGPKIKGSKDHSFEKPDKGVTVFYGRDRGEKSKMTSNWRNRDAVKFDSGEEFGYIYNLKDKKWYYKSDYGNPQNWTELK